MDYLLCSASVFNIVLISYDRFLSVTRAVSRTSACVCLSDGSAAGLVLSVGWRGESSLEVRRVQDFF